MIKLLTNAVVSIIFIAPLVFAVDEVITLKHNQPIYEEILKIKKQDCHVFFCKDEAVDKINDLRKQLRVPLRERVL